MQEILTSSDLNLAAYVKYGIRPYLFRKGLHKEIEEAYSVTLENDWVFTYIIIFFQVYLDCILQFTDHWHGDYSNKMAKLTYTDIYLTTSRKLVTNFLDLIKVKLEAPK
jgi:hypothetical protein